MVPPQVLDHEQQDVGVLRARREVLRARCRLRLLRAHRFLFVEPADELRVGGRLPGAARVALPQPIQVRGEAGIHVIARFGRSSRGAAREQEQQWRPWHHPAEAAQSLGTIGQRFGDHVCAKCTGPQQLGCLYRPGVAHVLHCCPRSVRLENGVPTQ